MRTDNLLRVEPPPRVVALRADRIVADLHYCLIRGVEADAISSEEWQELMAVYRSIRLVQPLITEIVGRVRAIERGAAR
jgi:hypothetical protein